MVIVLNVLAILALYMLFGRTARLYALKVKQLKLDLDNLKLSDQYMLRIKEVINGLARIYFKFYAYLLVIFIVGIVIFEIVTRLIEPRVVSPTIWLIVPLAMAGIAFAGAVIILMQLIARAHQAKRLVSILDEAILNEGDIKEIVMLRESLKPRVTDVAIPSIAAAASILAVIVGVGFLSMLFIAAEASISCARDPKCI